MPTVPKISSKEKTSPLVSIIIPAHNGMPLIVDTIESVRRQTYPHWELFICDDTSIDGTVAGVQQHLNEKPDPRIRLIIYKNRVSMTENWNRSLTYAQGDFIKLLPQDDLLHPQCLEIQQRLLQEHPDVGFVTSGKEVIDSVGRVLFSRNPLKKGKYNWQSLGPRSLHAVVNILGEPAGVLFRKDLLISCGAYDPLFRYFVDVELLLRFLKKSDAYVWENPLYQFRIHGNSATGSNAKPALDEYQQLLDRYDEELCFSQKPYLKPYLRIKSHIVVLLRGLVFRLYSKSI
jgi:glycosyltransferase involved in cell wall biosynthesis